GFNLGIIGVLHLHKNAYLRFIPALSFQERVLDYTFLENDSTPQFFKKRVGMTMVDFPLNFKFRGNRNDNNMAPYLTAGAKYSINLTSEKGVNNVGVFPEDIVVKVDKWDFAAQIGAGMDFFLQYFKFGIEMKLSVGLRNTFIGDDTMFSRPIESLRTKFFLLSFTFEG
ncbi:MAG: outer membrane beta-barrel protein, partial [Flavobacteriales bacterium]